MIVDSQFLTGVRTTFKAVFDQVMGEAPSDWTKFVTVVDTEGKTLLTFSWLGAPPMMRPMRGTLEFGKAFDHDYTITVTENAVGIEVSEQAFMSDPLSTITLFIKNLMFQAAKYEMKIACETLSDGFTLLAFDGAAFYADTRAIGDAANHDNKVATNLDNAGAAYQVGWQTINQAEDDTGEPMGLVPDVLACHSYNRLVAKQMLNATIIGNNSNVLVSDADLIVSPFFKTTKEWHLMATGQPIKPVIFAEQMPKRFVAQDGLDSEGAFTKNVYRYKVDNKIATGYGDPRTAYGSTGT